MTDSYQNLARHLNSLPAGFPPTESGVELRILKRLFTPHEAEMAAKLTLIPETAAQIAARLRTEAAAVEPLLTDMSKKGLIFRMTKNGETRFMAAQFVIGIWEYHLNDLDKDLIADVNAYLPYLAKEQFKQKTKQLRVVPVSQSISADMTVMAYDTVETLVRSQKKIVLAPCICRREHHMVGKGCDRLEEACLVFGGGAHFYEENGLGRPISVEEALEVLKAGMRQGLVLQPGNAKHPANICMCCACCCQILKNMKTLDNPGEVVCSSYRAVVDEDACTACGACEERCPMNAISLKDTARVDPKRCIGCGVCVGACDADAVHLVLKPESERWTPPDTVMHTYMSIAKERGLF